jgi:hypothetical protein
MDWDFRIWNAPLMAGWRGPAARLHGHGTLLRLIAIELPLVPISRRRPLAGLSRCPPRSTSLPAASLIVGSRSCGVESVGTCFSYFDPAPPPPASRACSSTPVHPLSSPSPLRILDRVRVVTSVLLISAYFRAQIMDRSLETSILATYASSVSPAIRASKSAEMNTLNLSQAVAFEPLPFRGPIFHWSPADTLLRSDTSPSFLLDHYLPAPRNGLHQTPPTPLF